MLPFPVLKSTPYSFSSSSSADWMPSKNAIALLHGLTIIPCVILAVAMFLSEWWVSHAPFQNVDKWYDYPGLFGVGAARGFIVAEALQHWYGTSIFWLPLLWGISQSLTYFIGYHIPLTWKTVVTSFAKGTPTSEFLADAFYFVSMLAIPLLPKLLWWKN